MAIILEPINLIIPLKNINYCYPGGFNLFSEHNRSKFGDSFCHDALLFRGGAVDLDDIETLVLYWQEMGLVPYAETDGIRCWKDMCVVRYFEAEPTLPCEWIEIDLQNNCVSMKGKPKGRIIGRKEMKLYYDL
ncbi:MAG TPA: hypothetical protein DDX85_11325 [Nitrospiraceae bacterium]|nr:hypothetical protein [Nitrospiraceae bacterium]